MATYTVTIPIAGAIHIEVEAENAKAAKDAAWERLNEGKAEDVGDIEWEFFENIAEGNTLHAPFNSVEVQKHKDAK